MKSITITLIEGSNPSARIQRWDNHGKLGYISNRCGSGRLHRLIGDPIEKILRIGRVLHAAGYRKSGDNWVKVEIE